MAKKATLAVLADQMERGFAAIATDIGELKADIRPIRGDITGIKATMATKDDVRTIVRQETADIRSELADIRRELKGVRDRVDNLSGVTKEIDHAFERIRRIEKHLGIEVDLAA